MSLSKATANTSPSVPEGVRPAVQFLTVSENNEAQRIDNFLFAQVKGIPKSKIYRVIRKGEVRINKKRCKPETKLVVGDVVRVPPLFGVDKGGGPVPFSHSQVCLNRCSAGMA